MDESLFQLIFILLIFVAAVFDSLSRGRKKRDRMEEMEREEAEAGSSSDDVQAGTLEPRGPESPRPEWESPEREEWEPEPRAEGPPSTPEDRPASGERETADRMIPEDLWAVLTGEEPPARKEPPSPPREAPRPTGRAETPRPSPKWEERRGDVEDALGRRSDPDPPEQPDIPQPVPGDRYRGRAGEDLRGGERRGEPRRPPAGPPDRIPTSIEDPWGAIPDISEGAIGEEERPTRKRRTLPVPGGRRRRPASRYARLIEAGDRESLREAIVLREVLDVPLARRGSFGGWEEER